ncbi:tol-pal system-associated acyl-CoA thioesterase [Oricola sp.]|uniref:tol-pal system-associated acyl-CoA thioesterase n=1 Tax=Oricola sp. TaxID=1979950 RepID=UPI0025E91D19|nr:tol-pal system-associated acyl-CoA thioesterase [Oricola sp.]MCI5074608.1 tol-pal system-associated acyl-CoA thioesterase [Oricola sp.]
MNDANGLLSGRMIDGGHELVARVYYADTDFSGAVYHARYLEFLERGRSDYLRLLGVHHTDLQAGQTGETLYWVVRRMEIDFRAAARIDDILTIRTQVAETGKARIRMAQEIRRGDDLLVTARVEAAVINAEGRPRRFPQEWAVLFETPGKPHEMS